MHISVVIPCFDSARYLREALESVCSQLPGDCEVIVVDDGSTDASASIAEGFGGSVRCVRQVHRGISATRNAGLAASQGSVIGFLDADDLWTTDSLQCRLNLLLLHPGAGCVTGLVEQFVSPELPEAMARNLVAPTGSSRGRLAGTLFVRRGAIDLIGGFDESLRLGETIDWVARMDHAGVTTETVERIVLRRRLHGANTGSREADHRADYLRMLKGSINRGRQLKDEPLAMPNGHALDD